jgi:amino acid adenylation domain-containing protein
VPLDPASPAGRLAWLLDDARSPVLITSRALLDRLPPHAAESLVLDDDREDLALESAENPGAAATAHNLAYVIYTSVSAGRTKGTLVSHYNVTRLFEATRPWFEFTGRDVWTLFHSYAFDFSVWELWGALLYGGRLVVVPYTVSRSPAAFYELLSKERVTVLNQTPSAFRQLMQAEEAAGVSPDLTLRLIIFGGEALELQSLKPWFERHGDRRPQLVNMYGITETTVHVTYRPLTADDLTATPGSVIGGPIPDLQVYILDRHMQPVPIGVPGEMYVGGAGLARGYLNRPDLTAQRYVPHPFDRRPGRRLYRSGDLARYLEGGDVEYLGRADHQVKIRGHRIELGEIEGTLNRHPAVRESVVVARDDAATGLSRLVAYVVPRHQPAPGVDDLRGWLKRTLPEYMIPQAFVTLDSLPLTANGKVDYRALPEADTARPELGQGYVAPRTRAERELAEVWNEVLGLERVGVNDNFFDLGGDSIRAIQVHSKALQRGVSFPLQEVFSRQTVAELAAAAVTAAPQAPPRPAEAFSLVPDEDRGRLPRDVEDAYPLAMLQAGMIFHNEYSAASAAYLNISSVHLRAPFHRGALEAALRQLAERHPVLRTSFDLTSFSEPLQLVHREAEIPLRVDDLRALPPAEREEVIGAWVRDEQGLAFDLSRAPLLRFQVHLRGEDTFQLSWTEHHAILDGWSVASMMTELFRLYFSSAGEEVAPVPPPPRSTYRDFVARERAALASEESRRFWEEQLSDRSALALPRRAPSELEPTARQARHSFPITPELSTSLKRLASSAGVPLKSVLLAAHLRVLSVLGNQRDVLTGLVSNGRLEEADGERALGLFLNTVPFRSRLRGGSWLGLIRETFRAEQELLPFRRYPLAELQRKCGGVPLFETMFNFTHFHVYQGLQEIPRLEILGARSIAPTNYTLAADFSLDLLTTDVQLRLEYNAARLSAADVEAFGGYYLRAFEAMVSEPSGDYLSHSLLSAGERHRLLSRWDDARREYPEGATLHGLFEEQAARAPEAEALCRGSERVNYGELAARADRLARRLRSLGVGPESRVGVLMNRSTEMVVALLGVLKAGGAYVPLDPSYPPERLRYMSEDAGVSVLLTQSSLADSLDAPAAHVLYLDRRPEEFDEGDEEASAPLPSPVAAENLAYVIYTSGSTGRPKGVAIEHRSAAVLVRWAREVFGDELLRGVLASTSICFDLSVFELFVPLSWGGRVILAENALHLPRLPNAGEVTLVNTVPSAMTELLRMGGLPESVAAVNLAGEALKQELVEEVYGAGRVGAVYNLYGPSEDTTYSTYALIGRGRRVTIGRPVANTQVYILSESLQPVPAGVAGEIYIGGDGLARGYLNRPELTAEKFIPDPFGGRAGARLYRTGDLGYYSPEGEIEFLGRADYQVKIRGFRIETGEVESVLRRHPQVRESVVLAREDVPGEQRLVAYIIPKGAEAPPAGALREHLKTKLPDHMIPSAFVALESLPLTPNGKVNRKALPAPDASRPEPADSYVGPRDTLEMRLCHIWEGALGVRPVGVKDNFFDLGGNSLLAVRLMAQIRKHFDRNLPINALFQGATVEHLAGVLRGQPNNQSSSSLVGIQTSGSRPPLFYVHPIGGTVFCYLELAKHLGEEQPLYGLQAPGVYGEREPLSRIEDLAAHYVGAVRDLQPRGPYRLGGWSMGGVVAFEMARQLLEHGEEVALLALVDSALPRRDVRAADSVEEEARLLSGFLRDLGAQSGKELPDLSEGLRGLPAQEQLARLVEQAEAHDILPPQTGAAYLESLLKVFKGNLRALSSYAPGRYAGRLLLFRSADALDGARTDLDMRWDRLAEGVATYSVPGNHYTLLTGSNVQALAALMKTHLEQGAGAGRVS